MKMLLVLSATISANPGYIAAHKYFASRTQGSWTLSSFLCLAMLSLLAYSLYLHYKSDS